MLEKIQKEVQTIANRQQTEIVLKVFQGLVSRHNPTHCMCDYCCIKYTYVMAKIRLHHLKKELDEHEYNDYLNDTHGTNLEHRIDAAKALIIQLKQEKDLLKCIEIAYF
jgi:hypothetical protein